MIVIIRLFRMCRKNDHQPKNANDTWHETKGIVKQAKNIVSGPKNMKGKTWHEELSDKVAPIKTYILVNE